MSQCDLPLRGLAALPWVLPLFLIVFLFPSCYVMKQGSRFLSIQNSARPVQKVLADPATPADLRAFLGLAGRIRAYAQEEIDLKNTKSYTALIITEKDYVADVVQACAELSFTRHLWNYPVVGKLPYKGFFVPEEAQAERRKLEAGGLDVLVRKVDAFSTLGWFADPLYSFMARYGEADLADLIIHELTHATLFIKGQDQFNEELASFVGRRGALDWLEAAYGPDAPQIQEELADRRGREAYVNFLKETSARLDALYQGEAAPEDKRALKARIIWERAAEWTALAQASFPEGSRWRKADMSKLNNAWFDLYRLYEGESELYERFFAEVCGSSLPRFVERLRELSRDRKARKDMKAAMQWHLDERAREGAY